MVAAQHATAALGGEDTARGWVDPFAAARNAGVLVAFRPLRTVSGVYVRDSLASGILVNSQHPASRQRYSAAHELGHHWLGHASTVDRDTDVDRSAATIVRLRDDEMVAEAFAAWFLMPRRLVLATLDRLGFRSPAAPGDVYQLALRLGTSFQATARQLSNLKLVPPAQAEAWLRASDQGALARLKRSYSTVPLGTAHGDVWLLGDGDRDRGATVRPGDRLVLPLREIPSSGYVWRPPEAPGWRVAVEARVVAAPDGREPATGQHAERAVVLDAPAVGFGEPTTVTISSDLARPWAPADVADRWRFEATVAPRRVGVDPALLAAA
jgi:Zn-dependent peptidase ImmA (M78 family)